MVCIWFHIFLWLGFYFDREAECSFCWRFQGYAHRLQNLKVWFSSLAARLFCVFDDNNSQMLSLAYKERASNLLVPSVTFTNFPLLFFYRLKPSTSVCQPLPVYLFLSLWSQQEIISCFLINPLSPHPHSRLLHSGPEIYRHAANFKSHISAFQSWVKYTMPLPAVMTLSFLGLFHIYHQYNSGNYSPQSSLCHKYPDF